ncbi:MAG: hypothetical protein QOG65_868 [Actinomycetota bacterium]|jgi:hypothetical protein|nr:hypothetical protein [Actinomycetota bacterium]MDQ1383489.1 hypothetical protein [Actinomycetota bacterium]MDQ1435536.1 hypothetical protein [Actinomycetota bacterium]
MSTRSRTIKETEIGDSQLRLLPGGSTASVGRPDWQLDERTRSVGLLGVAQAREVLRRARPPQPKRPEPIRKAS